MISNWQDDHHSGLLSHDWTPGTCLRQWQECYEGLDHPRLPIQRTKAIVNYTYPVEPSRSHLVFLLLRISFLLASHHS